MLVELGLDTLCYHRANLHHGMSVEDVLDACVALGVKWIRVQRYHLRDQESPSRLAAIGERARERGLRLIWSGDSLGQASWQPWESVDRIRTGIQQAVAVGAELLRMFPSWFRSEALARGAVAREVAHLHEVLTSAVPLLEEAGIVLAVENHSNLTSAEMADLIAGVGSLRVRIHLDLVNPIAVFEEPVAAIRRMAPYAAACDVKDLIVESEWATGEFHRKGFRVRYAWPGEGIFPLPEALAALGDAEGVTVLPLVIEGLDESSHPAEKARQSLTVLRTMMGRLPPRPAPV